jgi:predicted DNA-binding transcriptional regulator AlpA
MNPNPNQSLSAREAAALLGISVRTFYVHLAGGRIPLKKRQRGKKAMYLLRDVEKVAERGWRLR